MAIRMKGTFPFLYNDADEIVGLRNAGGTDTFFARAVTDATGAVSLVSGDGTRISAATAPVNRVIKRMLDTTGVTAVNSGTAATTSIDAASPFGRPGYKVAIPAGNTYHEVLLSSLGLANFDSHIAWRVWTEDYTALSQIIAYAGTTGYSRLWQETHRLGNSNTNRLNGEHVIIVGPARCADAATFVAGTDTLDAAKLRLFPAGGGAANVWVDAVLVPPIARPTHILSHDDTSVTWINNCLPVLAAAGLRATFGVSTADIGGSPGLYLSAAQVRQIADAGHQISAHALTNTPYNNGLTGTATAAQYTADNTLASAVLSGIAGQKLDTSYHPWVQGNVAQPLVDLMRPEGLKVARGVHVGHNFPQAGLGIHAMQLKTQALHTLTTSQIDAVCDVAMRYGTTVTWMVHEVGVGGVGVETSAEVYQYLVSRIARDVAAGARHMTMGEFGREVYAQGLVAKALLQ